jgi:hypothetical protein
MMGDINMAARDIADALRAIARAIEELTRELRRHEN